MDMSYVLSKPWLVGNNVLYDDHSNMYWFNYEGKKIKLLTSKPKSKLIEPKRVASKHPKPNETSLVNLMANVASKKKG